MFDAALVEMQEEKRLFRELLAEARAERDVAQGELKAFKKRIIKALV